jgi:hypothetical protein
MKTITETHDKLEKNINGPFGSFTPDFLNFRENVIFEGYHDGESWVVSDIIGTNEGEVFDVLGIDAEEYCECCGPSFHWCRGEKDHRDANSAEIPDFYQLEIRHEKLNDVKGSCFDYGMKWKMRLKIDNGSFSPSAIIFDPVQTRGQINNLIKNYAEKVGFDSLSPGFSAISHPQIFNNGGSWPSEEIDF